MVEAGTLFHYLKNQLCMIEFLMVNGNFEFVYRVRQSSVEMLNNIHRIIVLQAELCMFVVCLLI